MLVETAVRAATAKVVPARHLEAAALVTAVVDRSRRYTSERQVLAQPADRLADLAARALFFTIADAAKLAVPLLELAQDGRLELTGGAPLRVLDLGAGCGAMSLGLLSTMAALGGRRALHLTLIDQDERALAIAGPAIAAVALALGLEVHVELRGGDLRREVLPACDLAIVGTTLNELDDAAALALTRRALTSARLATILVEPALRTTARALHRLRDAILAGQLASVIAPCTHHLPCPMLATERDWCHEARPLALPPGAAALARATGLRDGDMKFAYLVLVPPSAGPPSAERQRVVSEPMPQKGRHELWVCGPDGHRKLRVLDRHRTPGAVAVRLARRGDVLTIAPVPDVRGDIAAEADVQVSALVPPRPPQ